MTKFTPNRIELLCDQADDDPEAAALMAEHIRTEAACIRQEAEAAGRARYIPTPCAPQEKGRVARRRVRGAP